MKQDKYYGSTEKTVISYLEFGAINTLKEKKEIWDFRLHQKAYDWFMLARYANDLITYYQMTDNITREPIDNIIELYKSEVHHQNDASLNLGKLCALITVMRNKKKGVDLSFFELGQTIFGCIEGMEFYQKFIEHMKVEFLQIDLHKVIWYGVDISMLLNKLSELLHEKYKVKTYNHLSLFTKKTDVFFAKGISMLYAIRSVNQLVNILRNSKLCIFDYSFSMDKIQDIVVGTGKFIRYLDFDSFYKKYKKDSKLLYVRKSKSSFSIETNRIFLDCVYAEEHLCHKFIELDTKIRNELALSLSSSPNALVLLDTKKNEKAEWICIEDFIESISRE